MSDPNIIPHLPASRHARNSGQPSRSREQRIDFWRGLCLIDMLLVHLYYGNIIFGDTLGGIIGNYTRFAAGGFIFISGMSIGVIFLPRALDPEKRFKTHGRLFRRALFILAVQCISAVGLLAFYVLLGARTVDFTPWEMVKKVLLLKEGGDLLPFYVMMIALSPLYIEIVRRRGGWIALLLGSAALFIWALGRFGPFTLNDGHQWALALVRDPVAHPLFPPILWQFIFVLGFLFGYAWPKYNNLSRLCKIVAAITSWTLFAILFVSEFSSDFNWPHLNVFMTFSKVPLSDGEALRYLSLIFGIVSTTDLFWRYIGGTMFASFVETLGRKSLPVYVFHLYLVEGLSWVAMKCWWLGRWEILFGVLGIAILWAFARLLDLKLPARPRPADQPHFLPGVAQN